MKICLVTGGTYEDFVFDKLPSMSSADLAVFAFGVCGFDSAKEAEEELNLLSSDLDCAVLAGVDIEEGGRLSRRVFAAADGEPLGQIRITHSLGQGFSLGGGYRVFDTPIGKLGVVVDTDIFFCETARILALSGAEILVCVQKDPAPLCLTKCACLQNGLTGIVAADGYSAICDVSGLIAYSSGDKYAVLSFEPLTDDTLLLARRNDLYSLVKRE